MTRGSAPRARCENPDPPDSDLASQVSCINLMQTIEGPRLRYGVHAFVKWGGLDWASWPRANCEWREFWRVPLVTSPARDGFVARRVMRVTSGAF